MIFANKTAADVWKENWCDRCCEPDQVLQKSTGRGRGCMIFNAALTRKTPPPAITPGRSGAMMSEAFKCHAFQDRPALAKPRATGPAADEPSLFGDLFVDAVLMDGDHA